MNLKKIINFLIVILFVLTLTVKADSGGPMFPEVDGEVKNDNAKCYELFDLKGESKTLTKGNVIKVRYVDGKRYEYDYPLGADETFFCYISANDLTFGKSEYKLTVEDKLSDPYDLFVVKKDGIPMYKGPLTDYEKLDVIIPEGTIIKTHYKIGSYWFYVSYNNVSGYVTSMDDEIVFRLSDYKPQPAFAASDLDIYSTSKINGKSEKIGTLPSRTIVSDYWYTNEWHYMYLTHEGVTGFVSAYNTFGDDCKGSKIKPLSTVPVYESVPENITKDKYKKVGTADANKEYYPSYCLYGQGEHAYFVDSLNGWIYYYYDDNLDYVETDKDGVVYDSRDYKEKHLLEYINIEGYNFRFEKDAYEYNLEINENDNKLVITTAPSDGITVKVTGNENLKNNSKVVITVQDDEGSHTYTINIIKRSSTPEEPAKVEPETKQKDNSYIIWICLGAALLLVITTIVIIILVNKKKKNNSVEVKKEINEEVPSSNVEQDREDTPKSEEDNNGLEN